MLKCFVRSVVRIGSTKAIKPTLPNTTSTLVAQDAEHKYE